MKVSEVMKKRVWMISEEATVNKAVSLMERYNFKELPIIRGNVLLGKISFFDIMEKVRIQKNEKVGKFVKSSPTISSNDDIFKAISLMINSGSEFIIVYDNGIEGVLSDYDIIKKMRNSFKGISVKDVMKRNIAFLGPDASISEAKNMMERKRIDRVPIVEKGEYLGQVVWADIIRSMGTQTRPDRTGERITTTGKPVSDILRTGEKITINDDLKKAVDVMVKEQMRGMPVLDVDGNVEGIIFRRDLLQLLIPEQQGIDVNVIGRIKDEEKQIIATEVSRKLKRYKSINQIRVRVKQIHGRNKYEIYFFIPKKTKSINVKKTGKMNLALTEAIGDIERILSKE